MSDSYRAICTDYFVNQKLATKLELPRGRETLLDLFERLRRQYPEMAHFRRYKDEVALESAPEGSSGTWASVRGRSVRSGAVNPDTAVDAYGLHASVLELAPYFLSISPLDIDHLELLFGFDLQAGGNHDEIVADALFGGSPTADLLDISGAKLSDCQPVFGMSVGDPTEFEMYFEVKTRPSTDGPDARPADGAHEPISVYLTLRRYGPFGSLDELGQVLNEISKRGEDLVESHVVPNLLRPIREAIASGNS